MSTILPDAAPGNWVDRRAPERLRPWLKLGRFDRPVGIWLLLLPGWWGVSLAAGQAAIWPSLSLLAAFAVGATLMRAAGCAFNDIVDRNIDAKIARTAARPVASGQISVRQAWAFVTGCSLVSFCILLTLGTPAIVLGFVSLGLVAAYPFMKRITWWPQAWLGIVFSWAALVGWPAATGGFAAPVTWLYAGSVLWVVGYDTIYAVQDLEDDALAGVRSSARRLGGHVRTGVAVCYAAALALWCAAFWTVRPDPLALAALLPLAAHLAWQAATLDPRSGENALARFRANRLTGLLVFLACLVVGATA